MTFSDRELSNFDGKPISLYEFTRGSLAWRYNTSDRDITLGVGVDAVVYEAVPVSDSGVHQSGQPSADNFEVTLPADAAVALLYRATAPTDRVWLKVRRMHHGDTEAPVTWVGSIAQATQRDEATAVLVCQSLVSSFEANGLRLTWQRSCPHFLYDGQCRADKAAFAVAATVVLLDGLSVQVSSVGGHAAGWFSGGMIEWVVEAEVLDRRMVETHVSGSILTLLGSTDGLTVGKAVTLYPGCNRTVQQCNEKFANLPNYGGVPHLPGKSPFDGSSVF